MEKISNWGNYPQIESEMSDFETVEELRSQLGESKIVIPRGNGRCYGDSALAPQIISTLRYDKILAFNQETGLVKCQSGVMLSDLLDIFVPRGWFPMVTPGTKLITIGGAIASDVHGKSHHLTGSFCDQVLGIELMLPDGSIKSCSPKENKELFAMTCGGMGLTGVILNATFRLRAVETAYMRETAIKAPNLDAVMDLFEKSNDYSYSVAWIDCLSHGDDLGRSIIMFGEHVLAGELDNQRRSAKPLQLSSGLHLNVPFMFPNCALNKLTMKSFNIAYYNKMLQPQHTRIVDYNSFFYPLDAIDNWNRIYGRRGFTQYQFVLPTEAGRSGLRAILKRIAESGMGSFLAVLKLFGEQDGFISFPMKGYTLALDFPIRPGLFSLFQELDKMVMEYGGRLYLAKDCRMGKELFFSGYSNAAEFREGLKLMRTGGPKFESLQSSRVGITGENSD